MRRLAALAARPSEPFQTRRRGLRLATSTDRWIPWVLPLPALVLTALLMVFPTAFLLYMSFHDWFMEASSHPVWIGIHNYEALLRDDRFLYAFARTGYFTLLGVAVQIPFGLGIALLLHQDFPGRSIVRTLLLLPMVAAPVAMALVWVMMLDPGIGVIRYVLSSVGIPRVAWLSDPHTVLPTLVAVDSWEWIPLVALMCLAGLTALPTEPFEAALLDGTSPWQRFWHLVLPMLRPTLVIVLIFRVIDLLKVVDIIYVMTRGGPGFSSETLNVYDFLVGLFYYRVGYGSAVAVVLFAVVVGVTLLLMRARRATW